MQAIGASGIVKSCNYSSNEIQLKNGSQIVFRSAERYDAIRGLTMDYGVLDEAAFMKDDAWKEAIRPVFMVRGRAVVFISTPKSKNWFYEMYQLGQSPDHPQYAAYQGTSYDTPFISAEDIEDAKRTLPATIFEQEYLARFIDSGGEVFSNIDKAQKQASKRAPFFMGVDFGKQEDFTVATVLDYDGNVVDWYRANASEWSTMLRAVADLARKWNATAMAEVNGVGDPLFEELRKLWPNTYPFVTTNKSKQEIIEGLILDFNSDAIGIPPREQYGELWSELEVFTYDYNPKTRSIRYGHPTGLHDDTVLSLAIANYNRKQRLSSGYAVVGSRR